MKFFITKMILTIYLFLWLNCNVTMNLLKVIAHCVIENESLEKKQLLEDLILTNECSDNLKKDLWEM